jgi:threonine dehydrogenase-like Zn-dependent dehydrogenase
MWCTKVLGARRVIAIDGERYRLDKAATHLGVETVNFREHSNIVKVIQDMMPGGPDVCIDAVSLHLPKTVSGLTMWDVVEQVGLEGASGWLHTVERAVGLETDSAEVINQAITLCRKGGIISLIGEYGGMWLPPINQTQQPK